MASSFIPHRLVYLLSGLDGSLAMEAYNIAYS